MSRTIIGVSVTVIAIIIVGAVVLAGRQDGNPATSDTDSSHSTESKQSNMDTSSDRSREANTNDEAVRTTAVDIKDSAFTPAKIQVKKGTAVTWTNQDAIMHDVIPDRESDDFKASKLLGKGETYTFTFNTVGTYTYYCSPHPFMKGSVEVVE